MDGWIDGWVGGWVGKWMDGWMGVRVGGWCGQPNKKIVVCFWDADTADSYESILFGSGMSGFSTTCLRYYSMKEIVSFRLY